jgi:hypothetical protein
MQNIYKISFACIVHIPICIFGNMLTMKSWAFVLLRSDQSNPNTVAGLQGQGILHLKSPG